MDTIQWTPRLPLRVEGRGRGRDRTACSRGGWSVSRPPRRTLRPSDWAPQQPSRPASKGPCWSPRYSEILFRGRRIFWIRERGGVCLGKHCFFLYFPIFYLSVYIFFIEGIHLPKQTLDITRPKCTLKTKTSLFIY